MVFTQIVPHAIHAGFHPSPGTGLASPNCLFHESQLLGVGAPIDSRQSCGQSNESYFNGLNTDLLWTLADSNVIEIHR